MVRFLLLLSDFFLITGCDRLESLFLEEDLLHRPSSKRCADCHQKIYNQWKNSRHSQAWVSKMITPKGGFEYKKEKSFVFYSDRKPDVVLIEIYRKLAWKREREFILQEDFKID